jgi:hypothetical protein
MRSFLAAILCTLFCGAASAQAAGPVHLELSVPRGKTTFQIGERIELILQFSVSAAGHFLDKTTTEPASPIDTIVVSPMTGVVPWLADQARGRPYVPDYSAMWPLMENKATILSLPLNAVYRFDAPGHYTIHVVTKRVTGLTLTSNDISVDIGPMSDAEDANRAAELEQQIRAARDRNQAQLLAYDLDWLTGDGSTRVKLSLFLHPKVFYPFGVDVTKGLWIARNRALVVAELEHALADPAMPLQAGSSLLGTAIALKARLQVPFNPAAPAEPLPTAQIEREYLDLIATTLNQRSGESLVTAARTLFADYVARKDTSGEGFATVREILITHFSEVNEFNVDTLLNRYGDYLKDSRLVPSLENILRTQHKPTMGPERDAVLAQLIKIAPQELRSFITDEVCAVHPVRPDILQAASFDTLPETNECLNGQIHAAAASAKASMLALQFKTQLAARFATIAVYDDLYALYETSSATWDDQSRGGLLGYFMRWDAARGRILLEAALPASADKFNSSITFGLFKGYYSAALNDFLRERLASGPAGQAEVSAYGMSDFGPAENQQILRQRLDLWRTTWTGKDIPAAEGRLEMQLVLSAISGKQWRVPDLEAAALRQSCISTECRAFFRIGQ